MTASSPVVETMRAPLAGPARITTDAWTTLKLSVGLREKKYARTKLSLLDAMMAELAERAFSDIPVRALCDRANISEATFFNYFPKKEHLLLYFIQVWTVGATLASRRRAGRDSGLAMIEAVFAVTAEEMKAKPRVMSEIIAMMARSPDQCFFLDQETELTPAERALAFGDDEMVTDIETLGGLTALFVPPLERAIASGELPSSTDVSAAVQGIVSIFFGVPLARPMFERDEETRQRPGAVELPPLPSLQTCYEQQLRLLWAGLRSG